jgi:hypothetical protein
MIFARIDQFERASAVARNVAVARGFRPQRRRLTRDATRKCDFSSLVDRRARDETRGVQGVRIVVAGRRAIRVGVSRIALLRRRDDDA